MRNIVILLTVIFTTNTICDSTPVFSKIEVNKTNKIIDTDVFRGIIFSNKLTSYDLTF